jgi:hypothetical protein
VPRFRLRVESHVVCRCSATPRTRGGSQDGDTALFFTYFRTEIFLVYCSEKRNGTLEDVKRGKGRKMWKNFRVRGVVRNPPRFQSSERFDHALCPGFVVRKWVYNNKGICH